MKRLIRKSEIFDSFNMKLFSNGNPYAEIFKDPIDKEIRACKEASEFKSIRGLIYEDGTTYVWRGDILHDQLNKQSNYMFDMDQFRFANERDILWIIDAHRKFALKEIIDLIIKHKDILSKMGNLESNFQIYFAKDRGYNDVVKIDFNNGTYKVDGEDHNENVENDENPNPYYNYFDDNHDIGFFDNRDERDDIDFLDYVPS